ncbi:NAD(P)-binding protein [Coccomyxa subellipsoidea C-169]|uniref:NAD(P)-binding protein n=1 Tax=Coccomyxa subellipsoidea (strain C-169) TaxID=574566 RepID=I0YXM4_COCSC|nr:NAD(P)-binding protein [Coccomyxa subellipsoidea C-169]EIE23143.1 NAD(P)-binding protein [Coccomyxa subellipsoidea C-169]|eukprot:XP_005647687.1 NAD(P)-binding protein [Coccomyxa subellipsoidea C-169]
MSQAQEQENWLLAGWERSKYDDEPGASLGVIVNIDRVVVVTGVSSGIGYAIAKSLVEHQCHVFGSVRKEADAKRLQGEFGDFFTPLLFDVTDEAAVHKAAADVKSRMKGHTLLGLINNAGIHVGLDATADVPLSKLKKQLDVNLVAPVAVIQAFLPLLGTDLTLRGNPGKILNMSSIYGTYTFPFSSAYSASKAGLNAISEGLRRELKPFGIDVVIIAPGPIETEIWGDVVENSEGTGNTKSPFNTFLERAHALTQTETKKPGWFLPAATVGEKVWKVLNTSSPAVHYVITPNWWLNWFAPTFFPKHLVDKEITRRFGLNKLLPRGSASTAKEE